MKYLMFLVLAFINSVSGITCSYNEYYYRNDCNSYIYNTYNSNTKDDDDSNEVIFGVAFFFLTFVSVALRLYMEYEKTNDIDTSSPNNNYATNRNRNQDSGSNDHLPPYEETHNNNTLPSNNNNNCNDYLPTYEEARNNNTLPSNNDNNCNIHLPTYEEAIAECDITVANSIDYSLSSNSSNSNNNNIDNTNNINHSISVV